MHELIYVYIDSYIIQISNYHLTKDMKNIIIITLLLFSTIAICETKEQTNDKWLNENGFMPNNRRMIGNYEINDCINQGYLAAQILTHKFQGISDLEGELQTAKSFHKDGRDKNDFLERKYLIRMEIIDQIYNRNHYHIPYRVETEDDRYTAVVIAAAERIQNCLGLND